MNELIEKFKVNRPISSVMVPTLVKLHIEICLSVGSTLKDCIKIEDVYGIIEGKIQDNINTGNGCWL